LELDEKGVKSNHIPVEGIDISRENLADKYCNKELDDVENELSLGGYLRDGY